MKANNKRDARLVVDALWQQALVVMVRVLGAYFIMASERSTGTLTPQSQITV